QAEDCIRDLIVTGVQTCALPILGALDALHQARIMLFKQCLPEEQIIVDLKGASHDHPERTLLRIGYPYHPHEIYIMDLPPSDRRSEERRVGKVSVYRRL